jgi:GTP 3',8-cyclase
MKMITHNIPFYCEPHRISINPYRSVRIKVTDRCSFSCNFCHHEGSDNTDDLALGKPFKTIINRFIKDLKLSEIHITGGEPTAYGELNDLIRLVTGLGLEAKMTSNGQFENCQLNDLKESGLKSINISVHTLDPAKLCSIMSHKKGVPWGEKALSRQLSNLIYAREIGLMRVDSVIDGYEVRLNDGLALENLKRFAF